MPQQPTIRRASPLDVVNLYRLVSEQGEINPFDPSDVAGALRRVLDAVQDGHVLVATNKAGRLVASVGFEGRLVQSKTETDVLVCHCAWFAVAPPYRESPLTAELLDLTVRAANENAIPVRVPFSPPSSLAEAAKNAGFKPGSSNWIWRKKNKNGIQHGGKPAREHHPADERVR